MLSEGEVMKIDQYCEYSNQLVRSGEAENLETMHARNQTVQAFYKCGCIVKAWIGDLVCKERIDE